MNIALSGYFDKNFGDDLMQLIVINGLKNYDFYVNCVQEEMLIHLLGKRNVHINQRPKNIEANVNVIGTGFLYKSKRAIAERLFQILLEKKTHYKKNALVNCSIEPIKNKISEALVRHDIRKYDFLSCRDLLSKNYINFKASKNIVRFHSDIVLSMGSEYIYPSTDENCLGIIPAQRSFDNGNNRYYKVIAKSCDDYISKTGRKVLLFAFDTGYENDTLAALSIKAFMKMPESAEIIAYNSDISHIMKNIARCEKIISSRFHGVVVAIAAGVPVAAICDTNKVKVLSDTYEFETIDKKNLCEKDLKDLIDKTIRPIKLTDEVREDARGHIKDLEMFLKGEEFKQ